MGTSLVILAMVMGSPFNSGSALKGGEALQQLTDFEKQYQADAKAAGKPLQRSAYMAAVKQKADDLLTGVDLSTVPTGESIDWAHVLDAATRYQDSVTILDRFIASNPGAEEVVNAKVAEAGDFRSLGEKDKVLSLLTALKPITDKQAKTVAALDAVQAQLIARQDGDDAGLKFLDTISPNLNGFADGMKTLKSVRGSILAPSIRKNLVGSEAPALSLLPGMYGSFTDLASLKGKVVILDFFAHWCPPCKASMPDMRKLSDDLGDKLQVVGVTGYYGYFGPKHDIGQKEEFADMKGFMDEYKIDHPVVYIDRGDFAQYGANGIPEFVLIGKDGKVKNVQVGYDAPSFAKFRELVEAETK